jgi:hypothetical protein
MKSEKEMRLTKPTKFSCLLYLYETIWRRVSTGSFGCALLLVAGVHRDLPNRVRGAAGAGPVKKNNYVFNARIAANQGERHSTPQLPRAILQQTQFKPRVLRTRMTAV